MFVRYINNMKYKEFFCNPIMLAEGNCRGYQFYVISYGTHPCCYIGVPEGHRLFNKHYDTFNFECHGGLTYSGFLHHVYPKLNVNTENWYLGWDYAHFLDRTGAIEGIEWNTQDLVKEVESVVEYNLIEEREEKC